MTDKSDDIAERLGTLAEENFEMLDNIHEPLLEAKREIERLRSIKADLCEALENIMITCSDSTINTDELFWDAERARAALAKARESS